MAKGVLVLMLVALVVAQDPIVQLSGRCPPLSTSAPVLQLTADVPAYALAKCRNGDKQLLTTDQVNYLLSGSFDQSNAGSNCLFYQKAGSNTYTVSVEIGWGEPSSQVVEQRRVKTISCAYDDHGRAVSSSQTVTSWFLSPWEQQHLLGQNATAEFELELWDVLDRRITADHIQIGRKIRLVAFNTTGSVPGLRVLSCEARNAVSRYSIVRAGCGDGLVFGKTDGFETAGNQVFSPYFDTFKLAGDDTVEFECVLTVCTAKCDGSSCPIEVGNSRKQKRSASGLLSSHGPFVIARSTTVSLR